MKKVVSFVIAALLLAVAGYFGFHLFNSTVSKSVDLEVARMIDRENSNLPKQVDQGVLLNRIENQPDKKQVVFHYQFEAEVPPSRYDEVQSKTNSRILNDSQIARAIKNGVAIFHEFSDSSGNVVLEFESAKQ